MEIDVKGVVLVAAFALVIIFLNQGFEYIGYSVADPNLMVELGKSNYFSGEKLQGTINITFSGPVYEDSYIEAELDGNLEKIKLAEYLSLMNLTYEATQEQTMITNPQVVKNLTLSSNKEGYLGLKLPFGAAVDSMSMKLSGSTASPTTLLSIDIPDQSGKPEWRYIGPFLDKYGTAVYPEGLDIQSTGNIQYLDSNSTYYCEQINLPYARDYLISAKYRPLENSTANLEALLLSFDGQLAYGGEQRCSLPKGGADLAWGSCNVSIEQGIQGYYLACLRIDKDEKSYEVVRDDSPTASKYNCVATPDSLVGDASCTFAPSRNYFIRVYPGVYQNNLTGAITAQEFGGWVTDRPFADSLTSYLSSCEPDDIGDCVVVMNFVSETGGNIGLSDLRIDYTEAEGGSSYTKYFYDLSTVKSEIHTIDGKSINKSELIIPLAYSNFTMPNVTSKRLIRFHLNVAGKTKTLDLQVYPAGTQQSLSKYDEEISDAETNLNKIKTQEIAGLLDIDQHLQTLQGYKAELQTIESMNISIEEKQSKLSEISYKIENYLSGVPSKSTKVSELKDIVIVNPSDLEDLFSEGQEDIFRFQEKTKVGVAVTTYKVTNHDGSSDVYSIVKKSISLNENLNDVYVYEVIPKDLARTSLYITPLSPDFEVEREDPVLKYHYDTLSSATISYSIKSIITQQQMYDLKTVVLPKKLPVQLPLSPEYSCGDGVCSRPDEDDTICPQDCVQKTKIPWLWISIIAAILILGLVYINLYKGKLSLGKILRKSPFKSEQDLENVKTYIKAELGKRIKKTAISNALLGKGWTQEQVAYAFEDITWDKKRETAIRNAPAEMDDMKKLVAYMTTCKNLNIPKDTIVQSLKAKGWKDDMINEGLKTVGFNIKTEDIKKEKPKLFFEE